ncbi:DUF6149 family protein [Halocatena salina]|uniref:DUF6149 family protein n=1 Tax=Halocatena salina TaxID=2934340 RepID=A0A8U0A4S1_9EURY|nr:DUF6149 family protein [Halocatena salina]UPM43468.1 DUF6149 family protein [Halocatena salina]
MKIRQNARHWATKQALTLPGVRSLVHAGLVRLHTNIFLKKADEEHRTERKAHLNGLFDGTIDAYTAALKAGYSEAEAREITHIQGNFDFYNHGWVEMMEIPVTEIDEHYRRYEAFFESHDITVEEPLGEFRPDDLPDAPTTPERLAELDGNLDQPNAVGGYADDVYVETEDGEVTAGGSDEPDDVELGNAVGMSDGSSSDASKE